MDRDVGALPTGCGNSSQRSNRASISRLPMLVTVKARLSRSWITHFRFRATFSKAAPTEPPRNICVNVVAPGATKTPIWKRGPPRLYICRRVRQVSEVLLFCGATGALAWGERKTAILSYTFVRRLQSESEQECRPAVDHRRNRRDFRPVSDHVDLTSRPCRQDTPTGYTSVLV